MRLAHEVAAPVGVAALWRALLDPGRVAAALPGATATRVEGPVGHGEATVRLGTLRLRYAGSVRVRLRDDAERRLVLSLAAADPDGGGLRAEVAFTLSGDDRSAVCSVLADLDLTGAPVRLGRTTVLTDLAALLDGLVAGLAEGLADGLAEEAAAGPPDSPVPAPPPTSPAYRRPGLSPGLAVGAAASVGAALVLAWAIRRRRSRGTR